ncbi:hypothetical protein BT63DRAFT_449468 [Microthyrium microscopicum]|uniref:DNA mismatch repair protein S5 domain-containing protein n=1 Tax=Microthyrium microscopicum TaxID=703497 RepID=A0A6A6UQA7_9PEZI|nr:hypothetical protein BT63DRAFT_449468 [Microthyrium microscopicum]
MPIQALPKYTSLLLSSGQALLDPASIVKELIDNSLDACASSITIEIASNTLTSILVRDNGRGISPDDRALIGQRYCTSKIRGFEDLERVAGTSLGFRGEAVSSLVSVAERVEVTTRIEGEAVGVVLKLGRDAGKIGRELAAHAVGTSVKAMNIFHQLPVRKHTAEKDAGKTIAAIRKTVLAYVFARPKVRFSFKVLGAKTNKANFLYAPSAAGSSVEGAVRVLLGKECASQCAWIEETIDGFTFQAVCSRVGSDVAKISNMGHFLSVDHRPVATRTGALKSILTTFRQKLKAHDRAFEGVKDPFLCLNINCPLGSYDANVEPLKNDLLFVDSGCVLLVAEQFFAKIYPVQQRIAEPSDIRKDIGPGLEEPSSSASLAGRGLPDTPGRGILQSSSPRALNVLDPWTPNTKTNTGIPEAGPRSDATLPSSDPFTPLPSQIGQSMGANVNISPRIGKSNMYDWDEDELENLPPHQPTDTVEDEHNSRSRLDISANPFTFAKMSAPIHPNAAVNSVIPIRSTAPVHSFTPMQSNMPVISTDPVRPTAAQILRDVIPLHGNNFGMPSRNRGQPLPPCTPSRSINAQYGDTSLMSLPNSTPTRPAQLPPRIPAYVPVAQLSSPMGRRQIPGGRGDTTQNGMYVVGASTRAPRTHVEHTSNGSYVMNSPAGPPAPRKRPAKTKQVLSHATPEFPPLERPEGNLDIRDMLTATKAHDRTHDKSTRYFDPATIKRLGSPSYVHPSIEAAEQNVTGAELTRDGDDDDEDHASKRQRTTRTMTRLQSANLPLNRIPIGQETHSLVVRMKPASLISFSGAVVGLKENVLPWDFIDEFSYEQELPVLCQELQSFWGEMISKLIRLKFDMEGNDIEARITSGLRHVEELNPE